jgi:hypothetical protein
MFRMIRAVYTLAAVLQRWCCSYVRFYQRWLLELFHSSQGAPLGCFPAPHPSTICYESVWGIETIRFCFSHEGIAFPWTHSEHQVNIKWTFSEHIVNIQRTLSEHSVNIQGTFSEYSGNIQGTFSDHSVKVGFQHTFITHTDGDNKNLCVVLLSWECHHTNVTAKRRCSLNGTVRSSA